MMFEIGVLFDIDALGGGFYGYEAWKIFMRHCKGENLAGTTLFEGDTAETLRGQANHFCIAIFALVQSKVAYVKEVMSRATDKGLLPLGERFIEGRVTRMTGGHQPLPQRARVDAFGRFVTDKWTRIDEELCEKTGWTYAPASVDELIDYLLPKGDARQRAMAARVLGSYGNARALSALKNRLSVEQDADVKKACEEAIAKLQTSVKEP